MPPRAPDPALPPPRGPRALMSAARPAHRERRERPLRKHRGRRGPGRRRDMAAAGAGARCAIGPRRDRKPASPPSLLVRERHCRAVQARALGARFARVPRRRLHRRSRSPSARRSVAANDHKLPLPIRAFVAAAVLLFSRHVSIEHPASGPVRRAPGDRGRVVHPWSLVPYLVHAYARPPQPKEPKDSRTLDLPRIPARVTRASRLRLRVGHGVPEDSAELLRRWKPPPRAVCGAFVAPGSSSSRGSGSTRRPNPGASSPPRTRLASNAPPSRRSASRRSTLSGLWSRHDANTAAAAARDARANCRRQFLDDGGVFRVRQVGAQHDARVSERGV